MVSNVIHCEKLRLVTLEIVATPIHLTYNTMKFSIAVATLLAAAIPPSEAFARPSFGVVSSRRSFSRPVNHDTIFPPRGGESSLAMGTATGEVVTIPTSPIEGMKPGTSGLRKKVEVWMEENYVENFIQSLVDTAADVNGGKMLDT